MIRRRTVQAYPDGLVEVLIKGRLKGENVKVSIEHFLFELLLFLRSVHLAPEHHWPSSLLLIERDSVCVFPQK